MEMKQKVTLEKKAELHEQQKLFKQNEEELQKVSEECEAVANQRKAIEAENVKRAKELEVGQDYHLS